MGIVFLVAAGSYTPGRCLQGKSLPEASKGLLLREAWPYGAGVFNIMCALLAEKRAKAVAIREMVFEGILLIVRAGRMVVSDIVVGKTCSEIYSF